MRHNRLLFKAPCCYGSLQIKVELPVFVLKHLVLLTTFHSDRKILNIKSSHLRQFYFIYVTSILNENIESNSITL